MTFLVRMNHPLAKTQIYELMNEQDTLFDYQLSSFFEQHMPIQEQLFSTNESCSLLKTSRMTDFYLSNNPFRLDYPVMFKEYRRNPLTQYVSSLSTLEGIHFWKFRLVYSDQTSLYIGTYENGQFSLSFTDQTELKPKTTSIPLVGEPTEANFQDTLFQAIRRNRLPRLFQ